MRNFAHCLICGLNVAKLRQCFSTEHAARMIENIFYYLTFQDIAHLIDKSKMSKSATYNIQIKKCICNNIVTSK